MSGGFYNHHLTKPFWFSSATSFREWLFRFDSPEAFQRHLANCGKPVVRVPVERQTPNEADL